MATKKELAPISFNDPAIPLALGFNILAKKYHCAAAKMFEDVSLEKHFFILSLISKNENMTQQCLAKYLDMDKAMVVRVIDYLSEKGFVKREINMLDRREHKLIATKKAAKFTPKINEVFSNINNAALAGFTAKETNTFYELMSKILDNMNQLPKLKCEAKVKNKNKYD
jgi:DNA-binding MarR family transcriptional regulator